MKNLLLSLISLLFFTSFSVAIDVYWVGGTGDWSDNTNHWSTASGGAPGAALPTNIDNVIFDNNSGLASIANTVNMDVAVTVLNFDYSAVPNVFTFASTLPSIEIQGSLISNGLANFTWFGDINMNAGSAQSITSNGQNWNHDFYFIGTADVSLIDDLSNLKDIYLNQGGFIANTITIDCNAFYSNIANTRNIDFDNTIVNVTGTNWDVDPTTLTWTAINSTINLNNTGTISFNGGNQVYNDVIASSTILQISNDNSFSLLQLPPSTQLLLDNSSSQNIDSLSVSGNCTNAFLINSFDDLSTPATITKGGFPILSASNLSITNVNALSPTGQVYNVSLSDTTGSSGWTFVGTAFYWINNSGNWTDPAHWSLSSNGPSAVCMPSYSDSVIFDALSFNILGQEVLVDDNSYFGYMDWSTSLNNPTLKLDSNLFSFGDVIFQPNLFVTRSSIDLRLEFNAGANFNPASSTVDCNISIYTQDDSETVDLVSQLNMTDTTSIYLLSGGFNTNSHTVNSGSIQVFELPTLENKSLDFDASEINLAIGFSSEYVTANFTFNSGTSQLNIGSATNENFLTTNDLSFHNVTLDFSTLGSPQRVSGDNNYAKLKIIKGSEIQFDSLSVHTISDSLQMIANCKDSIFIRSSNPAFPAVFNKTTTADVISECVEITGITCGNAAITTLFSNDNGGNTNWDFSTTQAVTASFTVDGPFCFGDTTMVTNNSTAISGNSADITSIWYFGDGSTSYWQSTGPSDSTYISYEADTNQHVFITSGDFDVVLVSTYTNFCTDTASVIVHINNPSVFLSTTELDTTICQGEEVIFEASSATNGATFEFFLNGVSQNTPSVNDTLYVTSSLNNNDSVSVVAYENSCPSDGWLTFQYVVNDLPIFDWTSSDSDTTICELDAVTFNSSSLDPLVDFQFLINGTGVTGYLNPGVYNTTGIANNDTVMVVGKDDINCTDTLSMIFTVHPLPSTTLSESSGGNVICEGDTITFTGSGAETYEFFINGVSQGAPGVNTFSTSELLNSDTVTVIGYSIENCAKEAPEFFTYSVNQLPNVSMSVNTNDTICSGTNVTFNAGGASLFQYFINGTGQGSLSSTSTLNTSLLVDGDEVYVLGDFSGCSNNSDTVEFTVFTSPTTTLSSNDPDQSICSEDEVIFTANGASNYEFFIDGVSQGAASPVNTFTTSNLSHGQVISVSGESNTCYLNDNLTFDVLQIPTVGVFSNDPDNIICEGDPITITGANANSYELYVNGTLQGGPQASNSFNPVLASGSNAIYIIGTAFNGCSDTSQTTINVTVNPIPVITLSSSDVNDTICAGESITFSGVGSDMFQFFVDGVAQGAMSTTNSFSTNSLTDGQTVQITGTTLSCPSNSNSIITAVNPIPVIGVSSTDIDNVFCADASVDFTASGADNYEFIVDGISQGPSSTTNTINSTGFNTGTYNIDIIGEQSNCISSTSISITVNGFPTANLVSSDLDNIICEGEAVTFTGSGGDLFQFEINGISQGTPSPVDNITFNNLTHNDVVSVIATSVDGCTNELAYTPITVNPNPIVGLTSSDLDQNICIGDLVDFTASGSNEYEFFVNGISQGNASSTNTFSSSTLVNGDDVSVVGSTSGCFASSPTFNFSVYNYPVVNLTNNEDTTLCVGENSDLVASGATEYQFMVNGAPVGGVTNNPNFTGTLINGDVVSVSGITNGCATTALEDFTFVVYSYPNLTSSTSAGTTICLGDLTTITGAGANSYVFSLNGIEIQNSTNPALVINTLEDGDVIDILGYNGDCASSPNSITFTVHTMDLTLDVSPSSMVCENENVTFTAGGASQYLFYINGIPNGTFGPTNTYSSTTLSDLDEVTVSGFNNTTGCTQPFSDYIIMNIIPEATITNLTNATFCEGDSVVLLSSSDYGNQWYLNGNILTGETDTSLTVFNTGLYSLAINSGGLGAVWSVGQNSNGSFGHGDNVNSVVPTNALNATDITELSAGYDFVLARTNAGTVYSWGNNSEGQLGDGTYTSTNVINIVPTLSNVKTIATSETSSMAVTNSGELYVWGNNDEGQLGTGNTSVINFPFLNATISDVDTVAGGLNHFVLLKNDGTVWTAGNNAHGQLGHGNLTTLLDFTEVTSLSNIVSIGAGEYHSFAIDNLGDLYVWGNNGSGQLGLNDIVNRLTPTLSPMRDVSNAQGGANHSIFKTKGDKIFATGGNAFGQLGQGNFSDQLSPIEVPISGVKAVSTGQYTTLVLRNDNSVFGFGNNNEEQLGLTTGILINSPEHINSLDGVTFVEASKSSSHFVYGEMTSCTSPAIQTNMLPVPDVDITAVDDLLSSTVTGVSYQWFFQNNPIPGSNSQDYLATSTGHYHVEVTLANGCTATSDQLYHGMTFIEEMTIGTIVLFPNPTKENLNLRIENAQGSQLAISIVDQTGRSIQKSNYTINQFISIDLRDLESGVYYVLLKDDLGNTETMKFIKARD